MALNLFDYRKSGKGVEKKAPEKKPFFKFWEIFARKFWKFFELNLIYVLFCLPIVTFGPATAALTHVMRKFVLEQPCFVFDEFFTAFKKNFKQSFVIGIIDVIFIAALSIAMYNYFFQAQNMPDVYNISMYLLIGVSVIFIMMHFYIYIEIVALKLKMKDMLKNALFLVFLGLKNNSLSLFISSMITFLIVMFFPYSVIVLPFLPFAWITFTTVFISYPVVQRVIINPYYEARGEKNPELALEVEDGDNLFVDRGGSEPEVKAAPKTRGKVIK